MIAQMDGYFQIEKKRERRKHEGGVREETRDCEEGRKEEKRTDGGEKVCLHVRSYLTCPLPTTLPGS